MRAADRPAARGTWLALRVVALALVLVGLYLLVHYKWRHPSLVMLGFQSGPNGPNNSLLPLQLGYGILMLCGLCAALVPVAYRRHSLLLLSAVAFCVLLGWWGLLCVGFAILLAVLGRVGLRLRYQIVIALAVWAVLPVARSTWFSQPTQFQTVVLVIVWAQFAYASLYLLVERARCLDERPAVVDDLFYILALPRLVEPFFQPISPRYLYEHERATRPLDTGRAVLLAVFGAGLGWCAVWLRNHPYDNPAGIVGVLFGGGIGFIGHRILANYCYAAGQIFVSMSLFRLLGFQLSSGFKRPFLSRSFRMFFRRWNHYIRDAVVNLFLFPLQGWLRRHMSQNAARMVASYLAIFVGSYVLNDLLIPTVTNIDMMEGAAGSAKIRRFLIFVVYWSAIILPAAGLKKTQQQRGATRRQKAIETVIFLLLLFALWFLADRIQSTFLS